MVYTEQRYTKDLDLWIEPTEPDAQKLFCCAGWFRPPKDIRPGDFTEPDVFFQIGIEPVRIDIVTSVRGLDFVPAWERTEPGMLVDHYRHCREPHQPVEPEMIRRNLTWHSGDVVGLALEIISFRLSRRRDFRVVRSFATTSNRCCEMLPNAP